MYTERQAIQDELHNNRREIGFLRERNQDLLKRLREIDERDLNDSFSYDALQSLTKHLTEIIDKLSEIIPHVSPATVIEHIANQVDPEQIIPAEDNEKQKMESSIQVAATKEAVNTMPPKKMSRERIASIIKEILEEKETMKAKEIEKIVFEKTGVKYVNFHDIIRYSMEKYPSISKAGRGYYTIRRSRNLQDLQNNG